MVHIIKGKTIFDSDAQTLVNTINCVGVMGKGIALEFKNRYPAMFDKYKAYCDKGVFKPGVLWIYKANDGKWILNFPTKVDWRNPSELSYIEEGLRKFVEIYKEKGITSIAFPLLGCSNGGLDPDVVIPLMYKYFDNCDGCDITIYDPREEEIEAPKVTETEEFFGDENPKEVVIESKPLVEEEPPVPTSEPENKAFTVIDPEKNPKDPVSIEPVEVNVQLTNSIDKIEQEIIVKPNGETVTSEGETLPIVVPEPELTEEQQILQEIIEERKAINTEVDKVLNEFAGAENTPETRKAVTKRLYDVINRRGFPAGSIFQI